jgi:hypothetical protein
MFFLNMVCLTVASPKVITRKCPVLPSTDSILKKCFQIISEFRTIGICKTIKVGRRIRQTLNG